MLTPAPEGEAVTVTVRPPELAVEASDGCVVVVVFTVLEGIGDVEPAFEFGTLVSGADRSFVVDPAFDVDAPEFLVEEGREVEVE